VRIKSGPVATAVPTPTASKASAAAPAVKPGAESATGWTAAFRALRDATRESFGTLVKAAGLTQALHALRELGQPPSERAEAVTLLASHVETLSTGQRAELLGSLQKTDLGSAGAAAATKVLLATHGAELTNLKNLVEAGGDLKNLESLVFDVLDGGQRAQVLDHFRMEAVATGENKLLSDIDDTVYASVNDPRFPKGTRYPGVRAFYDALDRGPKGDVLFLTARPRPEAEGTFEGLVKMGFEPPTVLTGGLSTYLRRMLVPLGHQEWAYPGMGARKVENFSRHEQLFPEYGYVFCGDNGQGDVLAGRGMLETQPSRMNGVFIHLIKPRGDSGDDGIGYFRTYVGAAVLALKAGLVSKEGAAQVAAAALSEVTATGFGSEEAKQQYLAELSADVKALDELLR
jgi:hypothetical protein